MSRIWHGSYDPRVPWTLEYPDLCLPLSLERNAANFPEHVATEFFGAALTYADLWDKVQRFATALASLGVTKGTRVAVMLPNCPQTVVAYYAVLWLGAVVVMTNPLYVEREMEYQWADAEAEHLVVLDHLYPKVERTLPRTKIRTVIATSLRESLPFHLKLLYPLKARIGRLFTAVPYGDTVLNFSSLLKSHKPEPPPFGATPQDLAALQYTGGTTGVSKGVMLSHANLMANVLQLVAWFPDLKFGETRFMGILPFFHVFGMTVTMNLPIHAACTIILVPRFEVNDFLKTLQKTKPTLFPGVPTIFVAIVNHPKVQSYDLSSIMYCITGSSPMPVDVLRRFEKLTGAVIVEGYGLTESSPVTHANPLGGVRKVGSIGIPLPDTDAKVVDLDLGVREMEPGEPGELIVRGPQVMKSYWRMPDETAQTLRDGWLYTGDIATRDEDGYFFIVDRKKDMIISGGYNIYPREIDEVLYEHPRILDAVAVGVPDDYRGEIVKAFIVPKPGENLTEKEIIAFCKERLAAYKVPRSIEFRDSLPKSLVGKVFRRQLRMEAVQQYEAQRAKSGRSGQQVKTTP
ncbi:MAG: long-chain fatty acid--CoA ligase [Deltaproteobacteria bacterium]|nr:long-chain fatty acid--CoA ligase [Deltaproteobacteria bacterium]